jgi:glycosyltransferase involved in cell wall biosynthesis
LKILFLSPDVPYPVRHGGHGRSFGLIRCLSTFASVHVLAIGAPEDADRPETREAFAAIGATIESFPALGPGRRLGLAGRTPLALWHYRSPALADALRSRAAREPPDVAHFEEAVMAQYAPLLDCPAVLDRQKVEWVYLRSVRHFLSPADALSPTCWWRAVRSRLEAARFRRWDESLRDRFAAVLVLGDGDRSALTPVYDGAAVHVIPSGVARAIRTPAARTREVRFVLLYGTLDYPPNAEANELYFREVWPGLRRAEPRLSTLVVGHGVPPRPLPADERVELRGFVPDILPVLGGPGALLVPLRVGGGMRTKILEALAAGMPVVSTAIGAENIGLVDGRHYLRAESPAEMTDALLRLARSPELAASLASAGAELIEERYRWEAITRRVELVYREAARSARRRA